MTTYIKNTLNSNPFELYKDEYSDESSTSKPLPKKDTR